MEPSALCRGFAVSPRLPVPVSRLSDAVAPAATPCCGLTDCAIRSARSLGWHRPVARSSSGQRRISWTHRVRAHFDVIFDCHCDFVTCELCTATDLPARPVILHAGTFFFSGALWGPGVLNRCAGVVIQHSCPPARAMCRVPCAVCRVRACVRAVCALCTC